jgi:hypothetical protein
MATKTTPLPKHEDIGHLINEWKNQIIESHNDAQKLTTSKLDNKENDKAIKNSERMNEVMDIINKLQNFADSETVIDSAKAKNYRAKTIEIFSNLIDQSFAWDNTKAEKKPEIFSKILSYIQNFSITFVSRQEKIVKMKKL